jgi:ABC-type dipeptide/oligopeptide/nickel transport system permease component
MLTFLLARLAQAVFTLLAVTIIVFFAARLTGSPEQVLMPLDARPEDLAAFRQLYGLDRPIPEQYVRWLSRVLQGDFGRGIHFAEPVSDLIGRRFANSVPLAAFASLLALGVGIPLGVLAATTRGQHWDRLLTMIGVAGQAVPSFWLGMVLILVFAVNLRLLPASGAGTTAHLVLPGVTIGYFMTAGVMRLVRSSMLEALETEYVKFARAKGLAESVVVWKHALRNALLPAMTFLGYMFGAIIAASITVETVFNWPGVGSLVYQGILARDFPVVQGVVLVWSSVMILINLLIDVSYLLLDPRVRIRG